MVEELKKSETPTKKEYVVERWWHRLLKTIQYITTLIILIGALFVVIYEAQYYTYSYSFEPDYAESKGKEYNCNASDYIDSIDCGDLNNGEKFTTKYMALNNRRIRENVKKMVRKGATNEEVESYLTLEEGLTPYKNKFGDIREKYGFKTAKSIIQKNQIKYKKKRNFNLNKLISGLGIVLLTTITWYILALVLYKIILYIVHGHTRVRKPQ